MKNMVAVLIYCLCCLLAGATMADSDSGGSPLRDGSIIVIQKYKGEPIPSGGVNFRDTERGQFTFRRQPNGDRHYLAEDGSVHHGNDARHTTVILEREPIPEMKRFIRFPPGRDLRPDMEWDTSVVEKTSCGDKSFEYRAHSKQGESYTLILDGKEHVVSTIQITYRATLFICPDSTGQHYGKRWERKWVALYVPSLDEFVSMTNFSFSRKSPPGSFFVDQERFDVNRLTDSAHGWRVVEINNKGKGR